MYGLATTNPDLTNFARTLLTLENQAVQTYWHMKADSDVYDAIFASNRMVGNIGALDVTASTWFGTNLEYLHGINMYVRALPPSFPISLLMCGRRMPVTPALAAVFDQSYVEQQWPVLASRVSGSAGSRDPACSANPGLLLLHIVLMRFALRPFTVSSQPAMPWLSPDCAVLDPRVPTWPAVTLRADLRE